MAEKSGAKYRQEIQQVRVVLTCFFVTFIYVLWIGCLVDIAAYRVIS